MTYVILTPLANDDIDELAREYSTAFLTSEASVTAFNARDGFYASKSIRSCTNHELLGKWAVFMFERNVAILNISKEFQTDKRLVDYYGDRYLGLCSGKVRKSELLACNEQIALLNTAKDKTFSAFSVGINVIQSLVFGCGISFDSMKRIEDDDNKHKVKVRDQIYSLLEDFRKEINTTYQFLKRDF